MDTFKNCDLSASEQLPLVPARIFSTMSIVLINRFKGCATLVKSAAQERK